MKVTMEEQKLYDDFTVSVFQRGYEKGKEDATISYQNAYNEGHVDGYAKGLNDRKKEIEKAKREGYDEGVTDTIFNTDTYTQGLNNAWECAKKIRHMDIPTLNKVFDDLRHGIQEKGHEAVFENYEPFKAIAKIKEYEDKHKCKECKWDEFRDAQSPVGTPCDSCFEGKNFSPKVARGCSILDDICPYDIKCEECEVHCSVERAKQKLKGDK
jgi:hypothetical protein